MATGESGNPDRAPGGEIERPDLGKLGDALSERVETRSVAVTGLFVLAVFYTLYFARAVLPAHRPRGASRFSAESRSSAFSSGCACRSR